MSGYSTREVADLVGLPAEQVRRYARAGVLSPWRGPRGEYRFDFRDMVLLRTARSLRDARVPPRRAVRALTRLAAELGDAQSLTGLRIEASGGAVVVHRDDAYWDAATGQGHLDFSVQELAGQVAELRQRRFDAARPVTLDADDFFNLGVDLEEVDPARAEDAYRHALDLDQSHADCHVNLGRLLQSRGRPADALAEYQRALHLAKEHQLALFNLGTLFDEQDDLETAAQFYRRAPDVADAHYNLCRIFELRGDEIAALRHLKRYRQLCANADTE